MRMDPDHDAQGQSASALELAMNLVRAMPRPERQESGDGPGRMTCEGQRQDRPVEVGSVGLVRLVVLVQVLVDGPAGRWPGWTGWPPALRSGIRGLG